MLGLDSTNVLAQLNLNGAAKPVLRSSWFAVSLITGLIKILGHTIDLSAQDFLPCELLWDRFVLGDFCESRVERNSSNNCYRNLWSHDLYCYFYSSHHKITMLV